jgi:precorrin-6A/cobalt-precorrin-6A reductase
VTRRVLLLGGTGEARELAAVLAADPGTAVTTALAGRTAAPARPAGDVRVGGFGGAAGLAGWLREHRTDVLVDATHPFAARISAHAAAAAAACGVPLLALRRPGWTDQPGDRWLRVPDAAAAAARLPGLGRRVFLTTGRGDLAAFAGCRDLWFLLRAVEPPPALRPAACRVLLDRGPFTLDGERALLREHRIEVLVTRDSGGPSTAAKLLAARELGLPVLLLDRPPGPAGLPVVGSVAAAAEWVLSRPAG